MSLVQGALYALLPAYHRQRDAELGYPLRALFAVLEEEGAATLDADLDAFHDSLFVETCAEALLPRIGALLGAPRLRPLPAEAAFSQRAFLGNLLRYRRAKGTPGALEMLARDVTLYSVKAVEYYARLSATPSLRAPRLDRPATARLNDPDVLARHGTAFDGNPRTPDMRSIARARGRYNIPHVGVHLWRLDASPFAGPATNPASGRASATELATTLPMLPWAANPGHFALFPDGRPVPLFMPQQNEDTGPPRPQDVPERLRRLPLRRDQDAITAGTLAEAASAWFNPANPAFTIFVRLDGEADFARVPTANIRVSALTAPPYPQPPPMAAGQPTGVTACFDPATARLVTRAPDLANGFKPIVEVRLACAFGQPGALGGGAYDRNDQVAPFAVMDDGTRVLTVEPGAPDTGNRYSSIANALAAWGDAANANRRGIIVVTANNVDSGNGDLVLSLPPGCDLTIVAAEWRPPAPLQPGEDTAQRPQGYIIRRMRRLLLLRRLRVRALALPNATPGRLTMDGAVFDQGLLIDTDAARQVELRHCRIANASGPAIAAPGDSGLLGLSLRRSVCAGIVAGARLASLDARDTLFAAAAAGITARNADMYLCGVTAFLRLAGKSVEASDSIFLQGMDMQRTQAGCLRYCYIAGPATDAPASRAPRRFRCQPDLAWEALDKTLGPVTPAQLAAARTRAAFAVAPRFLDTQPNDPGFGLLAPDAPDEIAFGGENETEMGAYAFLGDAARLANLTDLFTDHVPFGIEAGAIGADRSTAEAARRNLP